MVKENAEKDDIINEFSSASELPENKARHNFRLGDITWVKHKGSSWWPAQVIDESCVSSKPKKAAKHHALVRLYGTCQHLYVDPWKSNMEFKMMLKQENKSVTEAFHEVLEKELSHVNSLSDCDESAEEAVNLKATAKTSSRKVRNKKGLKRCEDVKESGTAEGTGPDREDQYSAEEYQELGTTAKTGVAARKGRMRDSVRKSSPIPCKELAIDKASTDNYVEGLRDKTEKQFATVRDKEDRKMTETGESVLRREGLRQSGRANMKAYSDATEDTPSQLSDTSEREDVTEVGNKISQNRNQHKDDSILDGIVAPHAEIRAMVKDILLGDIIASQHAAEMARVDDVINGICGGGEVNMTGDASASTKDGRGIKRSGSEMQAESYNITPKSRKGKLDQATFNPNGTGEGISKDDNSNSLEGSIDSNTGCMSGGQLSARQIRIMQNLALIAPSGSPFGKNGLVASTHR